MGKGGGIGGLGGGVGLGGGIGSGGSIGGGIEMGRSGGPSLVSGLARFDQSPAVSLNRMFGPSISGPEAYVPTQFKEGPVRKEDMQNSTVLQIGQAKEIKFNNPKQHPAIEFKPFVVVGPEPISPTWSIVPVIEPMVAPQKVETPFPAVAPVAQTESAQTVNIPSIQPAQQEQAVEEAVEEITRKLQPQENEDTTDDENLSESKVKLVEASQISQNRKQEIISAVKKLAEQLKGKITLKSLKAALSAEYWNLKSPIVKNKKDHTLDLTISEIESDPSEYKTPEEAVNVLVAAVDHNAPVKSGEDGRTATLEEVIKVIKGEKEKPKTPAEMVYRRAVKKTIKKQAGKIEPFENTYHSVEGNLNTLNLDEVFPILA